MEDKVVDVSLQFVFVHPARSRRLRRREEIQGGGRADWRGIRLLAGDWPREPQPVDGPSEIRALV